MMTHKPETNAFHESHDREWMGWRQRYHFRFLANQLPGFNLAIRFGGFHIVWIAVLWYFVNLPVIWQRFIAVLLLYIPFAIIGWTWWSIRAIAKFQQRPIVVAQYFKPPVDIQMYETWPSHKLKEFVEDVSRGIKGIGFADISHSAFNATLIIGPPGSGKTMALHQVAASLKIPTAILSSTDLLEGVQRGADLLGEIFQYARQKAPAVVAIDHLDLVGRLQTGTVTAEYLAAEVAFGRLIYELDHRPHNIIIVGATDRPDLLDPTLLRAGRFNRIIELAYLDLETTCEVVRECTKRIPLSADFRAPDFAQSLIESIENLTVSTVNLIMNDATIVAAKQRKSVVSASDFREALERYSAAHSLSNRDEAVEEMDNQPPSLYAGS